LQEENVIFVGYLEKKKLMCSAAGVELMINWHFVQDVNEGTFWNWIKMVHKRGNLNLILTSYYIEILSWLLDVNKAPFWFESYVFNYFVFKKRILGNKEINKYTHTQFKFTMLIKLHK
jgi:hypothetical protein